MDGLVLHNAQWSVETLLIETTHALKQTGSLASSIVPVKLLPVWVSLKESRVSRRVKKLEVSDVAVNKDYSRKNVITTFDCPIYVMQNVCSQFIGKLHFQIVDSASVLSKNEIYTTCDFAEFT